jgi:Zn-dependent peptidase ImmA (M78 family)
VAKEQFAQVFAAHFLMPPAKVREVVDKDFGLGRRLSYDDVLLIKRYFGTSAQAMLRMLRDLNLISAAQYEDFLSLDPVAREREVFGASAEEYGPASCFISDRYRLLEQKIRSKKGETKRGLA